MAVRVDDNDFFGEMVGVKRGSDSGHLILVPTSFTAHVDDGSLPVDLTMVIDFKAGNEQPACVLLTVQKRPDGPPVTSSLLHNGIRLKELVEQSVERAATVVRVETKPPLTVGHPTPDMTAVDVAAVFAARPRTRSNTVKDADLKAAVKAYQRHKKKGSTDPLAKAGQDLGISRSALHNRIIRARKEDIADV